MENFYTPKSRSFSSFLKQLDLFGVNINLSYRSKRSYYTVLGGLITIFFLFLFLVICSMFLKDLISKNDFNLITNSYIDPSLEIDFNTPILFTVSNNKGEIDYDERLYNFKILEENYNYQNVNGTINQIYTPRYLTFDRCDRVITNSSGDFKYLKDYDLKYFQCINLNQNLKLKGIQGNAGLNQSNFRIFINRCSNKTKPEKDCYGIEEINSKLFNLYFSFMYVGYNKNHYDKNGNNVEKTTWSYVKTFSTDYFKKFYFYFSKGIYNIDTVIFNTRRKTINFFEMGGFIQEMDTSSKNSMSGEEDSIGYVMFMSLGEVKEYTKIYLSLSTTLGKIGGFFNILLTVAQLINNYFGYKLLESDLILNSYKENGLGYTFNQIKNLNKNGAVNMASENTIDNFNNITKLSPSNFNIESSQFTLSKQKLGMLNKSCTIFEGKNKFHENTHIINKAKKELSRHYLLFLLCPKFLFYSRKKNRNIELGAHLINNIIGIENFFFINDILQWNTINLKNLNTGSTHNNCYKSNSIKNQLEYYSNSISNCAGKNIYLNHIKFSNVFKK